MKISPALVSLKQSVISFSKKLIFLSSRRVDKLEVVEKFLPEQTQVPKKALTAYKAKPFDSNLEKLLYSSVKEWLDINPENFFYKKNKVESQLYELIKSQIGERNLQLAKEYIASMKEAKTEYNAEDHDTPFEYHSDEAHEEAFYAYQRTVNKVNSCSNALTSKDPVFRRSRNNYISTALCVKHGTVFEHARKVVQFRAVIPTEDYGNPEQCFENGFCPQLLTQNFLFQDGLFNEPFIIDSKVDLDKSGWTGGVVSHSSHLLHSAALTYLPKGAELPSEYYVYATRARTFAPVSQHLDTEATTLSMDAQESAIAVVHPEDILYAIKVSRDGRIERSRDSPNEYIFNGVIVNKKMFDRPDSLEGDNEFIKFLNAQSVAELEQYEPQRYYNRTSADVNRSSDNSNNLGSLQKEWMEKLRNKPNE